jgi:hypothetical protein
VRLLAGSVVGLGGARAASVDELHVGLTEAGAH